MVAITGAVLFATFRVTGGVSRAARVWDGLAHDTAAIVARKGFSCARRLAAALSVDRRRAVAD